MKKPFPWFEVVLIIVFLSATVFAALSDAYNLPNRWFIRDDAYYYFKVAQNISEGRGSTFDGIHLTNGYHPLWLLVCIPIFALARFDLILPLRVLAFVTGALQAGTAILLYRLVRRAVSTPAAIVVASYWAFNTYILLFLYKTGVESCIALFLIALLLCMLCQFEATRRQGTNRRQIAALGIVGLLVALGRLDLIFFALIVGIWIVFRDSPMRYLVPLDILAVVTAVITAFLARLGFGAYYDTANLTLIVVGVALLIKMPALYLLRLYEPPAGWKPIKIVGRLVLATVAGSLALAAVLLGAGALHLLGPVSRTVLLLDGALSFASILVIRAAAFAFRLNRKHESVTSPLDQVRERGRTWLAEGSLYYGIVGGGLVAYMLWSRLVFGTFTPVSGQIKHWWGTFTHSIYGSSADSWLTFFAANPFSDFNAWAPPTNILSDWSDRLLYKGSAGFGGAHWQQGFLWMLLACLVLVSTIPLIRRKKSIRAVILASMIPLFVGSWLQILAYNVTGYASPKEWYWLTEPMLLVILGATLLNIGFDLFFKRWAVTRALVWLLVLGYAIRAGYGYWGDAYALNPYGEHPPGTAYTDVIPFLETSTAPGAVIGMTGGGNIGYLMPTRTIVNMDGLINSNEYFVALQSGTAPDYLYNTGMRYVFANPNLLEANPYRGQFAGRLRLLVNWGGKDLLGLLPNSSH
jgi:hypothetical protein